MAPRFTTLMYQIYPKDNGVDAIVCFPFAQLGAIFPFRDKLAVALLKIAGIRVNKAQGYPLAADSTFRFYSENHSRSVEEFLQRKEPGLFSRIMRNAEWASFQKEKRSVGEMINIEIETSHDFPCIVICSCIHSEESMSALLQEVANDLRMSLSRNVHLGSIRDIVMSNQSFEL